MRPVILYVLHSCLCLSKYQREPRGYDVKKIVFYLAAPKNYGIVLDPEKHKSLEVFSDANLCGN